MVMSGELTRLVYFASQGTECTKPIWNWLNNVPNKILLDVHAKLSPDHKVSHLLDSKVCDRIKKQYLLDIKENVRDLSKDEMSILDKFDVYILAFIKSKLLKNPTFVLTKQCSKDFSYFSMVDKMLEYMSRGEYISKFQFLICY